MVDFHSHLDLHTNPKAIVAECESRKLTVLSVTTTPRAWHGTRSLVHNHDLIFTALGIHPQLAVNNPIDLDLFIKLLPQTRFVGEIGIDGSREFNSSMTEQINVFRSILVACEKQGGCLLSVHSRNAASVVLDELEMTVNKSIPILHWFSGNLRELERAISLNCWFSVGPPMLYSAKGMQLIRKMPTNRILTETDSPFVQHKGQQLMPWDLESHQHQLSNLLDIDSHESERLVDDNCDRLINRA